ncbi:MAG: hypothetical protein RLZZ127_1365 [Planctomycetota bacterium]|jgi:L-alanine-DL-glutamate epimerase-like enolase superfamily enzyme
MRLPLALTATVIRLARPLATAAGTIGDRPGWLVDAGGVRGEAAPLPGFGGEAPAACAAALDRVRALGAPADGAGDDLGDLEPLLADAPCARAAVAGAVAAWRSRRAGQPLARWYAADAAAAVRVNGLGDDAPEAVVKLKVGGDPDADAARVRRCAGRRVRVDANGAWSAAQARRFLAACGPLDLIEDPVAADDPALVELCRLAPVALDAAVRAPADVDAAAAGAAAVVLKPAWLGGWGPTRTAAARARARGLRVVVSSGLESACGLGHAIAIAAALDPGMTEWHGLGTAAWLAEPGPWLPRDGRVAAW